MLQRWQQWLSNICIIYTPALVIGTCPGKCAPPGILVRLFIKVAEGIYITAAKQLIHPRPLIRQKAGIVLISYRVMYVYRLVADVIIPANDQLGTSLFQTVN